MAARAIVLVRKLWARPYVRRLLAGVVLTASFGVGALLAGLTVIARDLPTLKSLEDYRPPVTSRVFDIEGNLVARFFTERRTVVPVERIPAFVKNAFIAAEDAQFYQHEGLDYAAIVAAVLNELKVKVFGGSRRGGSTITQQTAKTFLLSSEQTYSRKIKEMVLAKRIEEELTKDEILHLYLNQIYFGHGSYGVEEAARTYYGVSSSKLTLGQAAVLASVPKWPNRINPFSDPARCRSRRAYVLDQMVKHGFATEEDAARAKKEKVRVQFEPPEFLGSAPYYAEHIRRQLAAKLGDELVNEGGLTVYGALSARLQVAADRALKEGLREVDKRQGWRGPAVRLDPDEAKAFLTTLAAERDKRFPPEETPELADDSKLLNRPVWDLRRLDADALRKDPERAMQSVRTTALAPGIIVAGVVKKVDAVAKKAVVDLGTVTGNLPMEKMKWARAFHPTEGTKAPRSPVDVLKAGDVILVRVEALIVDKKDKAGKPLKPWVDLALEQDPKVEGALIAIDPHSHRVLAMVGGYDFARSSFNRATQAKRQPGSSFKPIIYALGIDSKAFNALGYLEDGQSRLITDAPKVFFNRWTGKKWNPRNSGGRYRGDISVRTCLTFSVNTCSISILERVGVDAVHVLATKVGLLTEATPFPKNLTLALGTGEVVPVDLVNAYSIFPGEGMWAPPVTIEKVKAPDGTVLFENKSSATSVISPEAAYVMSDIMTSVVENGTGKRAKELGRKSVAGKTGTTNMARSVWFLGFTPDIVAGAYVGFDDNSAMGHREYGGKAALPIWLKFMEAAVTTHPDRDFAMPEGVTRLPIDTKSGLLANIEPPDAASQRADGGTGNVDAGHAAAGGPDGSVDDPVMPPPLEGELPEGVYEEVFISGTEPLLTAEDAPPPPLEFLEMGGGLGP